MIAGGHLGGQGVGAVFVGSHQIALSSGIPLIEITGYVVGGRSRGGVGRLNDHLAGSTFAGVGIHLGQIQNQGDGGVIRRDVHGAVAAVKYCVVVGAGFHGHTGAPVQIPGAVGSKFELVAADSHTGEGDGVDSVFTGHLVGGEIPFSAGQTGGTNGIDVLNVQRLLGAFAQAVTGDRNGGSSGIKGDGGFSVGNGGNAYVFIVVTPAIVPGAIGNLQLMRASGQINGQGVCTVLVGNHLVAFSGSVPVVEVSGYVVGDGNLHFSVDGPVVGTNHEHDIFSGGNSQVVGLSTGTVVKDQTSGIGGNIQIPDAVIVLVHIRTGPVGVVRAAAPPIGFAGCPFVCLTIDGGGSGVCCKGSQGQHGNYHDKTDGQTQQTFCVSFHT